MQTQKKRQSSFLAIWEEKNWQIITLVRFAEREISRRQQEKILFSLSFHHRMERFQHTNWFICVVKYNYPCHLTRYLMILIISAEEIKYKNLLYIGKYLARQTEENKGKCLWKTHSRAVNNNTSNDGYIKIPHDRED